jgi:hypothetical protein
MEAVTNIQDEVMALLLAAPTPEEIIAFHASEAAQLRLRDLLDANRNGDITAEEAAELEELSQVNHFVMLLKAHAYEHLAPDGIHS